MADPRPHSLADLFRPPVGGVLVPIVQRDYAQGRPGALDLRGRFLEALHDALESAADGGPPLDLDFVYGYFARGSGRFVPIDGQQRLTTLFLLHWYLAQRDGRAEDFQRLALDGDRARFQYAVRGGADDFLTALARCAVDLEALPPERQGRGDALSRVLRDQHWFFRAWRRDPTVRSCLTMLDAMHAVFQGSSGFYGRLVGPRPAITFQFLDLDDFGLGDELYIKMNARGRPLTPFEVFKSELEKFLRGEGATPSVERAGEALPLCDYVGVQLDTTWSHMVWALLRGEHADSSGDDSWARNLEPQLLNLMRVVAIITHPGVEASGDQAREVEGWLADLHNGAVSTFPGYSARGAVTTEWVQTLTRLMDLWSGAGQPEGAPGLRTFLPRTSYYDEAATLRRVREDAPRRGDDKRKPRGSLTYPELTCFAAYCLYLAAGHDLAGLDDWMRVASNLTFNARIEGGGDLRRALRGLRRLLPRVKGGALAHLASLGEVSGFSPQQVREEQIKAQLIQHDPRWRVPLERAELHPYFRGQVEFLLDASGVLAAWTPRRAVTWSPQEDQALRQALGLALRRAEVVFAKPGGGLTELPDFLWERALLCQGDYLLRSSSHGATWRLCVDAPQDPTSWKALLRGSLQDEGLRAKRAFALQVLREVDPDDLTGSLRRIVEAGPVDPVAANASWRAALIQAPQMLGYCEHRWLMLRWYQGDAGQWKQEVFLLWGQKRGSYQDVALWAEGEGLITAHQAGALAPLRPVELNKGSGTKVAPSIKLYLPRKKVASYVITRDRDTFTCQGRAPGAEPIFQCRRGELLERVRDLVASLSQGPTPGA